jgi:hypothetical protein
MRYKRFFKKFTSPPKTIDSSEVDESTKGSCLWLGISRGFISTKFVKITSGFDATSSIGVFFSLVELLHFLPPLPANVLAT